MADLVICVNPTLGAVTEGDDIEYSCSARCAGMSNLDASIVFQATAPVGASPATIHAAIRDAGIAAVALEGHVVGELDHKTILGAAVEL